MNTLIRLSLCACLLFSSQANGEEFLRLATTTSTENSGLLAELNPPFEKISGAKVHIIAVGTGKALRHGADGDVDIVFVHAPSAEKKFVEAGYGVKRQPVMHNDFVLLGPPSDPADIRNAESISDAMTRINNGRTAFVSRGDDSGTHKKERQLWQEAAIKPGGEEYLAVGQGMGQVLQITHEKQAYTLSDRGTYLAYRENIDLQVVFEGAPELVNPYHVIVVNPARHPHVKSELAQAYVDYLVSERGQSIIRNYRVNGEPLFYPDVIP